MDILHKGVYIRHRYNAFYKAVNLWYNKQDMQQRKKGRHEKA